jgi:hypothetical protein
VAATPVQDAKAKEDRGAVAMDPAAMARMMQAGTPGPEHKELARMVGKWDCDMSYTMDPSAPPMPIKGTSTFTMLMGDRYLQEEHESSGPMGPFKGRGTVGYNNMTKQFEGTWIDSMGTATMFMTGTQDASGDVTMKGEYMDPMTNAMTSMRHVMHKVSDDAFEFKMYCSSAGKPEFCAMTSKYTRAK